MLREAFKALLKDWGKSKGLFFTAEYPIENAAFKHKGSVDGALLYELRRPFGYWIKATSRCGVALQSRRVGSCTHAGSITQGTTRVQGTLQKTTGRDA